MKEIRITACPFCSGTEFAVGYQGGYGALASKEGAWLGVPLYHTVCRDCGSVVRSYVKNPEKLVKKNNRRREL